MVHSRDQHTDRQTHRPRDVKTRTNSPHLALLAVLAMRANNNSSLFAIMVADKETNKHTYKQQNNYIRRVSRRPPSALLQFGFHLFHNDSTLAVAAYVGLFTI